MSSCAGLQCGPDLRGALVPLFLSRVDVRQLFLSFPINLKNPFICLSHWGLNPASYPLSYLSLYFETEFPYNAWASLEPYDPLSSASHIASMYPLPYWFFGVWWVFVVVWLFFVFVLFV